jgi:hypothetical protein
MLYPPPAKFIIFITFINFGSVLPNSRSQSHGGILQDSRWRVMRFETFPMPCSGGVATVTGEYDESATA